MIHMFSELVMLSLIVDLQIMHEKHTINASCWLTCSMNCSFPSCFLMSYFVLPSLDQTQPFEIWPLTAVAGDDVTLTCRGTRYLYDRLHWYGPQGHIVPKDQTTLQIESYTISLSIKLPNVSRNHTLGYECQALNINSNKVVNTTSLFTIKGKFELPRTKEFCLYESMSVHHMI